MSSTSAQSNLPSLHLGYINKTPPPMSTVNTCFAPHPQLPYITRELPVQPTIKASGLDYSSDSILESSWLESSFTTSTESATEFFNQTLNESDWEDIFETVNYASPDISKCIIMNEASQELDVTGREFLSSPAIPSVDGIQTLFGDILFRNHQLCLPDPIPLKQDAQCARRTPHLLPIRYDHNYIKLRPLLLRTRMSMTGKSARTRLFSNLDEDDKGVENFSPNIRNDRMKTHRTLGRKSANYNTTYNTQQSDNSTIQHVTRCTGRAQTVRKSKNCSIQGCLKGARSKGLCKRHGGGKRCMMEGCTRSDQGGGYCIAHGGGKRCAVSQCSNSAQSRGLCKSHGGGKRCAVDGCLKSSQEGGFCRFHRRKNPW